LAPALRLSGIGLLISTTAVLAPASVQLEILYPVIERYIAKEMFTHEGRQYVRGSKENRCNYAYLENPRISASGGRLIIKARFSGRSSLDLLGACVGMGDSFDLTLRATPFYEAGFLGLRDVEAAAGPPRSLYMNRVLNALSTGLPKQFRFPLREETRKILEHSRDPMYSQRMLAFHVVTAQAANHALVLILDFRLEVK
jgi:hypothetical protein